jgi:hypothetical protein
MRRILEPELLDSLPPDDPAAVRSRADLRRVNWWMRNQAHVFNAIQALPNPPRSILEIGAGDGTFLLKLAQRFHRLHPHPVQLYLLDKDPVVSTETVADFRDLGWNPHIIRENVLRWADQINRTQVDLIVANLFLHHFAENDLRNLLHGIAQTCDAFVACEPRRWRASLLGTRLLWLIGCNHVTRHDALVSVRAGFNGNELRKLWPHNAQSQIAEQPSGFASHLFVATKSAA